LEKFCELFDPAGHAKTGSHPNPWYSPVSPGGGFNSDNQLAVEDSRRSTLLGFYENAMERSAKAEPAALRKALDQSGTFSKADVDKISRCLEENPRFESSEHYWKAVWEMGWLLVKSTVESLLDLGLRPNMVKKESTKIAEKYLGSLGASRGFADIVYDMRNLYVHEHLRNPVELWVRVQEWSCKVLGMVFPPGLRKDDYMVTEPAAPGEQSSSALYRFEPFPEGKHIEINQLESWELKRHLVSSMAITLESWRASDGPGRYKNGGV
jgi:hypothetical protein